MRFGKGWKSAKSNIQHTVTHSRGNAENVQFVRHSLTQSF